MDKITCPRRVGELGPWEHLDNLDRYDENECCSFCGGLSPKAFFEAVERGEEIEPTDKNYKAYVRLTNPEAISRRRAQIEEWIEADKAKGYIESAENRFTLVKGGCQSVYQDPATIKNVKTKVYFQHFSEDDKKRFVDLINSKKMNVVGGGFYRLPFFCVVLAPQGEA